MPTPHVEVTVMDGVVHSFPNGELKTVAEYAEVVFIPCVLFALGKPNTSILSGMYTKDSRKLSMRANRGRGTHNAMSV